MSDLDANQLSARWLGVCRDLIDAAGPVFDRPLGSTLERFSIDCAGPICRFKANGLPVYSAVLITNGATANCQQTLSFFSGQLEAGAPFEAPAHFPAFLVLNTLALGVAESDRAALFQLAYHFAGAYFSWSGA
ncbi:hypothetical protein [Xanthomonas bonasiae]|uniref:hypothetical protein n=1 Tax=Xanthomonas bonasiae TaxID=2810351 RepID=UPI00177B8AF7|nr:hypothetical protein [Xanthomonas surreyensis]MBD7923163.1 hypothetical protein [Xanthomonas surreyensis]